MASNEVESNQEKLRQAEAQDSRPVTRVFGRPFQKGQSGNPSGKRKRATGAPGDRLLGSGEPTREMILREAYRTITVRDGDEVLEMSASQAVFRSLTEAAMAGNQAALRRWTEIVGDAEAAQKRAQLAIYNVLERGEKERAAKMRERYDDDTYDPYAEDIIVDSRSGTVVIRAEDDDHEA